MNIAIHQPNYMPWLGYFLKIYLADIFVFHDDVLFSKSDYTKRTKLRKEINAQETQWLTVPIEKANVKIKDVKIVDGTATIEKHLQKIYYLYHKAPYYLENEEKLKLLFLKLVAVENLGEFNIIIIREICNWLEIKANFHKSSMLSASGQKGEYNINICSYFAASAYFSGKGANAYQSYESYLDINCDLIYLDMYKFLEQHPYTQEQGDFINGLSVIDALMNIGAEGILSIFEQYKSENGL